MQKDGFVYLFFFVHVEVAAEAANKRYGAFHKLALPNKSQTNASFFFPPERRNNLTMAVIMHLTERRGKEVGQKLKALS